ncbi:AAA family ATPase [Chamaesiphon sp. GL140_3_metabinner_50]|uniref:AAA family ATPase n=1 Tax=Chamaesiphon sp. GL140_3_metabinner_50 TaxID=2970812 RepID=UPI0025CE4F0E|nr:AAA family ATPase [Chamaesiphon sp. GL140_3_metabinner_50]
MQIKSIKVDNFKSLVNFDLPLTKFSCLVGLNGSGKSTVLQFFDFLSQQVKGDISGWLKKRQWESSDINSKLNRKKNINFEVLLSHVDSDDYPVDIKWSASFNFQTLRCTNERVELNNHPLLHVENKSYNVWNFKENSASFNYTEDGKLVTCHDFYVGLSGEIPFDYQGSIISQIKESQLRREVQDLKKFFIDLHALDLLAPELLRQRTRDAGNSLGLGGEKLSAFLHEIGGNERDSIQAKLAKIYPRFRDIDILSMRSGWKSLTVREQFGDTIVKTEARHVADGFLRMLAVFAQLSKEQSFLLLDEIENGVNPELIEFLVDELVAARPQVLITTHSPMVLNYLEDDIAIAGIIYIYKNQIGATQAIRLFDIPRMREKLTVMGAGEVYEDTLLTQLNAEILGAN